mgnify:CR=1 FL=1
MSYIRTLLGKLGFEVDSKPLEQFNEEIDGTSEKMEDAGDASEGLLGRMAKLNQAWELAAKLGGAVLGTLKDLAFSTASHAAGVADAAAQIGVETRELQRLHFALEMSGGQAESVNKAILEQNKLMREGAANAASPFVKALEEIGLKLETVQNLGAEERCGRIGESLAQVNDKGRQAALSLALFGGEGSKILPLALEGRSGIAALGDEAERLGYVLGDDVVAAGSELDDSLQKTQILINGIKNDIGASLMPTVTELVSELSEWIKENRELIASNVKGFIEGLISAGQTLAPIVKTVAGAVSTLISALGGAENATGPLIAGLGGVRIALMACLGPWGLVAAAALAAGVAIVGAMQDSEKSILATERAAKRLQGTLDFEEGLKGKSSAELRTMLDELETKRKQLNTIQEDVRGKSPERIKELEAERAKDQAEIKKRQEILGRVLGKSIAKDANAQYGNLVQRDDAGVGVTGETSGLRLVSSEENKQIQEGEAISDREELKYLRRKGRKSASDRARILELQDKLGEKPTAGGGGKGKKAEEKKRTAEEIIGIGKGGISDAFAAAEAPSSGPKVNNFYITISPTNNIGPFTVPEYARGNSEQFGRHAGRQVADALHDQNVETASYFTTSRSGAR